MSRSTLRDVSPTRPPPAVSSVVLAMLIFVVTEVMLFAGLISAFIIVKASALGPWPPPGQPRLPVGETAFNTAALLASGVLLFLAARAWRREHASAVRPLTWAIALGGFFVVFQGYEWVQLLGEGLTLTSSTHGSFFYLIVGLHGLHAVVALGVLVWVWRRLRAGWLNSNALAAAQIFWFFVVGLWPVLYLQVYLA